MTHRAEVHRTDPADNPLMRVIRNPDLADGVRG
jgi:hypothetical protein